MADLFAVSCCRAQEHRNKSAEELTGFRIEDTRK